MSAKGAERAIARVLRQNECVGLAFVVGRRTLITCAHVINSAAGRSTQELSPPPPDLRLVLDFPFGGGPDDHPVRQATVAAWWPSRGSFEFHDVAGLRILEDLPAGVPTLRLAEIEAPVEVQLWGPSDRRFGHVAGQLMGRSDKARFHVDQDLRGVFRVERGFSGGPAWLPGTHDVVGMLQATAVNSEATDVYLLGVHVLAQIMSDMGLGHDTAPNTVPQQEPIATLASQVRAPTNLELGLESHQTPVQVSGRRAFIEECIPQFLRAKQNVLPTLLLYGSHGTGKSQTLCDVWQRCGTLRPRALIGLGGESLRPHEIAALLARQLSVRTRKYGRLSFPRLALGLASLQADIEDGYGQAKRPRHLEKTDDHRTAMRQHIARARFSLRINTVNQPLESIPSGPFEITRHDICARGVSFRPLGGGVLDWYRDGLGRRFDSPIDALILIRTLNTYQAQDTRDEVDEALCGAFLADLRAAFSRGLGRFERTENCIALIDDADSDCGQAFLWAITRVRLRNMTAPSNTHDPFLIVATGHTRFQDLWRGESVYPQIMTRASYGDWDGRYRSNGLGRLLYPVSLEGLDEDDARLTSRTRLGHTDLAVLIRKFASRLTVGHPWGYEFLLRVIHRLGPARDSLDLRTILTLTDPHHTDRTVAESIVDQLLPERDAGLRRNLVTCAAASDVETTTCLRALGLEDAYLEASLERFLLNDLWVTEIDGEHGARTLHPFLRRMLLHLLAARDRDAPDGWAGVHQRLRDHGGNKLDDTRSIYHALASAEPSPAVAYLERLLEDGDSDWMATLDRITSAPRAGHSAGPTPNDEVYHHVSALGNRLDTGLARLVVAKWISSDPLGDPHHSLDSLIAAELEHLARRAPRHADKMYRFVRKYRMAAMEFARYDN